MKPLLIVPVGIPASGKSWLADWLVANHLIPKEAVVSSDGIREMLCDTRTDMSWNWMVFSLLEQIANARLENGLIVYLDATNLTVDSRATATSLALSWGADLVWVRLETEDDVALTRNRLRPEPVPEDVMGRFRLLLADVEWDKMAVHGTVMSPDEVKSFMMNRKFVEKT